MTKMRKLLIVCGPTATGKTALALSLARKFKGELVSADSKQVYKGLNIGTGKDLPLNLKLGTGKGGFCEINGTRLWGYDLVGPKDDFSVALYVNFAQRTIVSIQERGKLPILVGGTGLYIKAIVDGIPTVKIPQNKALRKNLTSRSTGELFEMLAQLDPIRAGTLNASDKKNPRRLIRGIEIATWKLESGRKGLEAKATKFSSALFIGLTAPKEFLFKKIKNRVKARLQAGVEEEIKKLIAGGVTWEDQSMSSLGYRQWRGYFEAPLAGGQGRLTRDEAIKNWEQEEKKYAKRQITWFKKDKRINWFDITNPDWTEKVEKLVKKWYISSNSE